MKVFGLGSDIVAVERIERLLDRQGHRFRQRCFRQRELAPMSAWPGGESSGIAVCWAAKEAYLKALGMRVTLIPYRHIEIVAKVGEMPQIIPHGQALAALTHLGAQYVSLTLSQTGRFAMATVILDGEDRVIGT